MKTSEFTDKKVTELSRSQSDEFSEFSYSRGRESEDVDYLSFGLSKDDSDSTFRFRHERPVVSSDSYGSDFQNRSAMDFDHVRVGNKKIGTFNDGGLISMIGGKMEEYSKSLLHAVEGLSVRLCQLETRTRNIENSVDELKNSSEINHRRTEQKLRELENVLTKLHAGIGDLRDKQEISEMQIEMAKLQILKDRQQSEQEKTKTNVSSGQAGSSAVQQQSNPSPPAYNVAPPQQFPSHPSVSTTPSHQSLPPPIPSSSGQFPTQSLSWSPHPTVSPPILSPESTHQQYSIPPNQPTSSFPYQPYQPVQQHPPSQPPLQDPSHSVIDLQPRHSSPLPRFPPTLQPQQLPPPHSFHNAGDLQAHPLPNHNFERTPYMQLQTYNNIHNTYNEPDLAPRSQQVYFGSRSSEFSPDHVQPSRHSSFHDEYTRFGPPSHANAPKPRRTSSELRPLSSVLGSENRFSQAPNSQALPRALPMASEVSSGSGSGGTGVSIEDVTENVVAMGFRRDLVRAMVKKMTENGQSVDLNLVLDKLMNSGEAQNDTGRQN